MMDKYIDSKGLKTYTSLIKEQIDKSQKAILDTKAQANGIATLDSKGHVPLTQLGNVDNTLYELSSSLPTNLADTETLKNRINHIFIIPKDTETTQNAYKEYIYTGTLDKDGNVEDASKWEELGEFTSAIDLQDYCKKSEVAATYLPLAGGSMNESAMINMDKGTINLNADESNYIVHSSTTSEYVKEVGTDASKSVIISPTAITVLNQDEAKHEATTIAYNKITVGENITLTEGQLRLYDGDKRALHTTSDSMYSGTSGNVAVSSDAIKLTDGGENTTQITYEGVDITAEDGSNTQHNAGNSAYSKTEEDIAYSTNVNNRGVFIVDGADNVVQHTSTYSQYYSNDDTSSHTQIDKGGLSIANAASDSTTEVTLEGVSVGNESAKLTKDKLIVGNASLTTDTLSVSGGAGSLTASKLTLANGAATMDSGSISLAQGGATLNPNQLTIAGGAATLNPSQLTLGGDIVTLNPNALTFNNGGGQICLSTSTTGTSMTGYGIYWDKAGKDYINLNNGLYLHSGDSNGKIAYLRINPYNNNIAINKPIIYGVYSNICLDLWGEGGHKTQGLFLGSYSRAFTAKGVSLHKSNTNDSYKNAILRNMPSAYMDKWEDKLQYTIGPKDTSFTTEYEAVAPLVQDPDDSSKWTIPSEYLPDSSGGSSDSVELYIPKFIESVKGQQLDLYFDNVSTEANEHDVYPMRVASLSSNLVKIEKNHYRANPSASDAIFIEKYDNSSDHNIILTKSFTNYVVTNNPTGLTKNICIMGDGLISETYMMAEIKKLFDNASLGTINLIGTKTTTLDGVAYTHEGRKDWDWTHYLDPSYESKEYSGSTNAFVVDGEINFQKYMSKYFPSLTQTIDYFVICMGTKEVMTGATDDTINTIIENTKSFVDTLLSSDKGFPDCVVAILLQPSGPYNSNNTKFDIMEYQSSINKLNKALIETFDAGAYNTHVTTSGANIFINKYDGYDYKDIAVDEYSSRTVRQYNNIPYLSEIGSRQYGKGVYNKLRAFIDGNL